MRHLLLLLCLISSLSCRKFVWDNPNDTINSSTEPASLKDGLVAYYPFNGNANDESINKAITTVSEIIYTKDRMGNSTSSAGISKDNNGFVRTSGILNNIQNNFSVSFWVSPSEIDALKNQGISGSEGSGTQTVIHPTHGANWGDENFHTGIGVNVGLNQIQVVEHTGRYVSSPLVYQGNFSGWHHVLIVYSNKTPSLYVDGVLKKTGLKSIYANVHPSNGFDSWYLMSGFGRSFAPAGVVGQFVGSFDDFRIYNRALTQAEITYLANN